MSTFVQVLHFWRYQFTFSIQRVYRFSVFFYEDDGKPQVLIHQFDDIEKAKAYCTPLAKKFENSFDEFYLKITDNRTGNFERQTYGKRTETVTVTELVKSGWVKFN